MKDFSRSVGVQGGAAGFAIEPFSLQFGVFKPAVDWRVKYPPGVVPILIASVFFEAQLSYLQRLVGYVPDGPVSWRATVTDDLGAEQLRVDVDFALNRSPTALTTGAVAVTASGPAYRFMLDAGLVLNPPSVFQSFISGPLLRLPGFVASPIDSGIFSVAFRTPALRVAIPYGCSLKVEFLAGRYGVITPPIVTDNGAMRYVPVPGSIGVASDGSGRFPGLATPEGFYPTVLLDASDPPAGVDFFMNDGGHWTTVHCDMEQILARQHLDAPYIYKTDAWQAGAEQNGFSSLAYDADGAANVCWQDLVIDRRRQVSSYLRPSGEFLLALPRGNDVALASPRAAGTDFFVVPDAARQVVPQSDSPTVFGYPDGTVGLAVRSRVDGKTRLYRSFDGGASWQ
jgi:hypothetical protein